ncbi:MBOAT family O-acyltransferase [Pseudoroseomonas globiformis]|uniref:Probable alginate O-acetylase AlgI n=1 Tax=Teichococcus globiformis TaxID=2307229 RepID=A0ABV7G2E9_9PROT
MLFNSHIFILAFLPLTLAGWLLLGRLQDTRPARLWLLAASLVFYGWWSWLYLGLLLLSMAGNYSLGNAILSVRDNAPGRARLLAILGISANVGLLAWYKYSAFVLQNVGALAGLDFAVGGVILPLAISFYTFLQIAYLADCRGGRAERYSVLDYTLFVTFFPHLIAGPIVHHNELIPQFHDRGIYRFRAEDVVAGLAFFILGLLKKLVLADPVGALSAPVFQTAAGAPPGFAEAWIALLAFSAGLYFDFSAYSDMAIGLARMFGIRFPYNFNSPYQAVSMIDFWRRWHMTLSRFLRDYIYIPLGGSRQGSGKRHVNLMATMVLGGLWHGAGWTFVVWGALHGFYLLVNHLWRGAVAAGRAPALGVGLGRVLTLLAVMLAWVFFAAPDLASARAILGGLSGTQGWAQPETTRLLALLVTSGPIGLVQEMGGTALLGLAGSLAMLGIALVLIMVAPNSQAIIDGEASTLSRLRFRPRIGMAVTAAGAFLLALSLMADVKEFVYFQF